MVSAIGYIVWIVRRHPPNELLTQHNSLESRMSDDAAHFAHRLAKWCVTECPYRSVYVAVVAPPLHGYHMSMDMETSETRLFSQARTFSTRILDVTQIPEYRNTLCFHEPNVTLIAPIWISQAHAASTEGATPAALVRTIGVLKAWETALLSGVQEPTIATLLFNALQRVLWPAEHSLVRHCQYRRAQYVVLRRVKCRLRARTRANMRKNVLPELHHWHLLPPGVQSERGGALFREAQDRSMRRAQ